MLVESEPPRRGLRDALQGAFPSVSFNLRFVGYFEEASPLWGLSWFEGPSVSMVSALIEEYESSFKRSVPSPRPHSLFRAVSSRRLALHVGSCLPEPLPLLPEELFPDLPSLPSPLPLDLLQEASMFLWGLSAPGSRSFLALASHLDSLLQETDLSTEFVFPPDPFERLRLECFATLTVDVGALTFEQVLLYALSGGWDMARVLALPLSLSPSGRC